MYTVVVEEADFCTVYWLLKWVYANWTLFRERDDPKAAVEGVGAGWSARSLRTSGSDEWEWRAFSKTSDSLQEICGASDARSIASMESGHSNTPKPKDKEKPHTPPNLGSSTSVSVMRSTASPSSARPHPAPSKPSTTRPPPSPSRRIPSSNAGNQPSLTVPASAPPPPNPPSPRAKPTPMAMSPTAGNFSVSSAPHHPFSPRQQRQRSRQSQPASPDPHPHPTPAPPPASALSMYQVAHRYTMPGLAALALEHMMSTITPQSSFALLLATSTWDELHTLVEVSIRDVFWSPF